MARPIVLSGPSGTGKSTLLNRLFAEYPGKFGFSVSHTTRAPRAGEVDGRDYNFVTREEFEDHIENKAFIEHAQFSGNYYGTSSQAVKAVGATGRRCILDIDSQGVKLVKANHPSLNSIFVFLCPPSLDDLKARLRGRGSETEDSMAKRLAASQAEIQYAKTGAYDLIIVNDDVERAYNRLKAVCVDDDYRQTDQIPETL